MNSGLGVLRLDFGSCKVINILLDPHSHKAMSFLLPLLFSSPSLGTTPILDMAPPLKMHDSCRAEALIDVSDETLSAMDSNPFAGSNSQLLFPTIGTQFVVHAEAILDPNLKYKSSPHINVALPDSPPKFQQ